MGTSLDGVAYFSSSTLHCAQRSQRSHAGRTTLYSHSAIMPVLVQPGQDKVVALAPEFVTLQDGLGRLRHRGTGGRPVLP